jgi:hypothetical protein
MKALAAMVAAIVVGGCAGRTSLPPDPGPAAVIVTVLDIGPTSVTIRQRGTSKPLHLPGPIVLATGQALELNLQEVDGARPWTNPASSNPGVLAVVSSKAANGYLVALFRTRAQGPARLQALFPCRPGACAVALFFLDVTVQSS